MPSPPIPKTSALPHSQPSSTVERFAVSIANARKNNRSDAALKAFCLLQPSAYLRKSPETRHALLKDMAELLLLRSLQDIALHEYHDGKTATPNQNIGFGVRWDKVFNTNSDAGAVNIVIPRQALAQLQVGIAVQVSKGPQPVGHTPLGSVDVPIADTPT
jgi:hypothetical protein